MIPSPMRSDTKSPAERRLYELFRTQLSDDWLVFHSVPWQARNVKYGARDGEADFVLLHPDIGLLVLEVKGGHIRYVGESGQWFSNEYVIHDPFEQAKTSKYHLLQVLKEQPYWSSHRINIGHAVAFPDVDISQSHHMLRPDAPRTIILDKGQTRNLEAWLHDVFHYWSGQNQDSGTPGQFGAREVKNVLSPSLYLKPLLSSEFEDEEEEFLRLTQEQFQLLDFLRHHRRVAISGCAGSGKTLMAVEKAKKLHQQGFSVLLTCYNYNLAAYLRESVNDYPNIHVHHFHGLCSHLAKEAGLLNEKALQSPSQDYYNTTLPSLLFEAIDRVDWRVDAIVIDEGQDFREEWELALQYLLHDPDNGIFYIFYDNNQKLYQEDQRYLPLQQAPFPLSKNCRNTRHIHNFALQFYDADSLITSDTPQGREVVIERYSGNDQLKKLLRRTIHHLVQEEQVAAEDIVILTPRAPQHSALTHMGMLGNFRLVSTPTWASGEIFYTTIHQYKGLESPVVILVELEPDYAPNIETLLYIGSSRARNHLIVLSHEQLDVSL
ncbi:NERD domain-containing protein [Ktedonobacter racemifer]|nr:NERD domain-containing protein [Ktedonobacter racemifer]